MNESSIQIANNIITGTFTLIAAFGGVWLRDYFENKKTIKMTLKQKALEAYALADQIPHALISKQVICSNLTRDPNYNYFELQKAYPDNSFSILAKLELLIIENFYDINLREKFNELNILVINQSDDLLKIMSKSVSINEEEFITSRDKYNKQASKISTNIKDELNDRYINKKKNECCNVTQLITKFMKCKK